MAREFIWEKALWYRLVPSTGERAYFENPIFNFNKRDDPDSIYVLTACSGIAIEPGGIDNLYYYPKERVFKVDWRPVEQERCECSVVSEYVPAIEYRNFHHLSRQSMRERYFDLPAEIEKKLESILEQYDY